MKSLEMYSRHREGKSVVAERFIRTLNNKIYKYMTQVSKTVCIDKLDGVINKYNNTCSTIKMKLFDVKLNTHFVSGKEIVEVKDPKLKINR